MKRLLIITIAIVSLMACKKEGKQLGDQFKLSPDFIFVNGDTSGEIQFKNKTSKGPGVSGETYHWDLGDGSEHTAEHPIHYYKKSGNYTVKMTVRHDGVEKSIKRDVYVFVSNGGGNNGGGGVVKNETVTFWTTNKKHLGASVSVDGLFAGTITKYYSTSYPVNSKDRDPNAEYGNANLPSCGTTGMVTISKPPGTYKYSTTNGLSGNLIVIPSAGCTWVRLYP